MDIDDIAHPPQQHTSILDGIESRTTNWIPPSPTTAEDFLPIVDQKKRDPFIATGPEKALSRGNLLKFADDLHPGLKEPLLSTTGKNSTSMKHPNASFIGEYRFRHLVPFLYTGNHLSAIDKKNLEQCCRSAKMFSTLWKTYGHIDTSSIRGFESYRNSTDEVKLNHERIRLHTAAFIQHNCDVEKLIYYLGGPHIGRQPIWEEIIDKIRKGVHPNVLAELERVYRFGAPREVNATNTEENLLQYFLYGNHESVTKIRMST